MKKGTRVFAKDIPIGGHFRWWGIPGDFNWVKVTETGYCSLRQLGSVQQAMQVYPTKPPESDYDQLLTDECQARLDYGDHLLTMAGWLRITEFRSTKRDFHLRREAP